MTNKLCPELIRRKTETDPATGCWNWTGSLQTCGYGQVTADYKNMTTHRATWVAYHGAIPAGMHVLHHCDNRRCCNPAHLYLGTHADNMRDMVLRGRSGKGGRHGPDKVRRKTAPRLRKLTNEQVLRIRNGTEDAAALAKELGIVRNYVYRIRNGTRKSLLA